MKSFTLRLGIKITNFGTDLIHDVVQLLSCMLLVSSTKGYKVLTVIFNSQEPNNGITSRHNSALSWMLGPYILGLYFFSLNISVNIIFIILNIRLKNKGMQELIPRLTFRTKNEYNLIFWKLTMTVLANVQNRCNGIKNNHAKTVCLTRLKYTGLIFQRATSNNSTLVSQQQHLAYSHPSLFNVLALQIQMQLLLISKRYMLQKR